MGCSEWKEVKLGEIIKIEMGQSPKSEYYNTEGEGLPFLQGNRTFGYKYPFFDTYCTENTKMAISNDVIMSVRAPVGDLNIAQTKISIGRGVCAMRLKDSNNSEYLYYLMKHNIKEMINRESGTVFGSVNKNDITGLCVKVTENKFEQKAIAHILSTLDEKIETNNRINQLLEEMAQLLFKRWFVDFEFPNEDGEPYKSSGGEVVESELGLIPKGWGVKTLDDIGRLIMGVSPSSDSYNKDMEGLPLINGASDFNGKKIEVTKFTTAPKKTCDVGDMIFGVRATIGNTVFAGNKYALGRGVASVSPLVKHNRELLYFMLEDKMSSLIGSASGSVFLNVKKDDLQSLKIAYCDEIVNMFHETTTSIIDSVLHNDQQNHKLATLRDTLLPKLMSGEIRVPCEEDELSDIASNQ